jgi:hypothetical protein
MARIASALPADSLLISTAPPWTAPFGLATEIRHAESA